MNSNEQSREMHNKETPDERMISKWENEKNVDKKRMLEPYIYSLKIPKMEIRSQFIDAMNHWMKIPQDKIEIIKDILSMFYDVILLQDDIEDGSIIRRGAPVSHRIYGIARTITACNGLFFEIMHKLSTLDNPKVYQVFAEAAMNHSEGKTIEYYWQEQGICPTVEEFMLMTQKKMQGGFDSFVQLMQIFSDYKGDLTDFMRVLSSWYHIQNDFSNLDIKDYQDMKDKYADFFEGRYTLSIIHAVHTNTYEGNLVHRILKNPNKDITMVKYCKKLLKELGSIEYMRQILVDVEKQLKEEIEKLGGNPLLTKSIDKIIEWRNDEKMFETIKK